MDSDKSDEGKYRRNSCAKDFVHLISGSLFSDRGFKEDCSTQGFEGCRICIRLLRKLPLFGDFHQQNYIICATTINSLLSLSWQWLIRLR